MAETVYVIEVTDDTATGLHTSSYPTLSEAMDAATVLVDAEPGRLARIYTVVDGVVTSEATLS